MFKRALMLAYATSAYALALVNLAYIIGFIADFGVPKGIGDGPQGPVGLAVAVDTALVLLFGFQHSLTARLRFKQWWTRFVAPPIERATYLYMTAGMTYLLVAGWRPIPITLWEVSQPAAVWSIYTAFGAVWIMMFLATFHFGHLNFFGLRQALDRFQQRAPQATEFSSRYFYALVRHPISVGWMLAPWLTPHMTVGQLVFALSVTIYILAATGFEEADLISELGDAYRRYRDKVPAFVPRLSLRTERE